MGVEALVATEAGTQERGAQEKDCYSCIVDIERFYNRIISPHPNREDIKKEAGEALSKICEKCDSPDIYCRLYIERVRKQLEKALNF